MDDESDSEYVFSEEEPSEDDEYNDTYDEEYGLNEERVEEDFFMGTIEEDKYVEYFDKGADESKSTLMAKEYMYSSSTTQMEENEAREHAISESMRDILPELEPASVQRPMRMTDLGFKISQIFLEKRPRYSLIENNDDVMRENMEDDGQTDLLLEKTLSGKRRNRTGVRGRPKKVDYGFGKSTTHTLPPEVAKIMGQANISYVSRRYEEAIKYLLEVIRQAPQAFEAYQTLAMIHEEQGEKAKALSYYVIAAHLIKTDLELWRKLAQLTLELGRKSEAIYYLGRLIKMRNAKPEYFWKRAWLFVERGDYKRAVLGFHKLLLMDVEDDGEIFLQVNTLSERLGVVHLTGDLFSQIISEAIELHQCPSLMVIDKILALFLEKKEYDRISSLVNKIAIPLVTTSGYSNLSLSWYGSSETERTIIAREMLLPEIRLYYIISSIYLKSQSTSDIEWAKGLDYCKYGSLLKSLGKALLDNMQPLEALSLLLPLMDVPSIGDVELGIMLGECHRLVPGQEQLAIGTFEAVLEMCPDRGDVRTMLCDLYRQTGQASVADEMMRHFL